MHRRRAVVLALLAAAARSVHAIPKEFYTSSRDSGVCPKKDLEACPSSLPSGFCCPSGQQCLPLAGLTTALCCPKSRSCEKISPIACDVKLQDPKENPDATVITSVFDVDLETCDNGCCPFGYACADRVCVRNASQSKKPGEDAGKSSSSPSPSSTGSASSTAEATSAASTTTATDVATLSQTATATATATATSTPDSSSNSDADAGKGVKSKTMSIIGGVVGATLVLLILVVVGILCVRHRRTRAAAASPVREKTGYHRAGSSTTTTSSARARGLYISEPILQENSYRSDFILKSPSAASSISQRPTVDNQWSSGGGGGGGIGVAPPRIPTPASTNRQQRRDDDLEFPNPFSSPDPSMAEDRRYSLASSEIFDETGLRTGHVVTGKPAPIRNMRPSSRRISREPQHLHAMAAERIDVFSDEYAVPPQEQLQDPYQQRDAYGGAKDRMTKITTFSQLMDKADLGDVYRGKRYVPGSPPRL
ncbi:hypothetical protein NHJ13734_001570 [Beauveria thailandica]